MSTRCPVDQEVKKFKKGSLKKTEVQEKNPLPTIQGMCYRKTFPVPGFTFSLAPCLSQLYPCLSSTANIVLLINCVYTPSYLRVRPCSAKCHLFKWTFIKRSLFIKRLYGKWRFMLKINCSHFIRSINRWPRLYCTIKRPRLRLCVYVHTGRVAGLWLVGVIILSLYNLFSLVCKKCQYWHQHVYV